MLFVETRTPFPGLAALPVAMTPSFDTMEGLSGDPRRLDQVFPGVRATSDALAPTTFPLFGQEAHAVPGAPPSLLSPYATLLVAPPPPPAQQWPGTPPPSPGKDAPFFDDEMISDLLDRLN